MVGRDVYNEILVFKHHGEMDSLREHVSRAARRHNLDHSIRRQRFGRHYPMLFRSCGQVLRVRFSDRVRTCDTPARPPRRRFFFDFAPSRVFLQFGNGYHCC